MVSHIDFSWKSTCLARLKMSEIILSSCKTKINRKNLIHSFKKQQHNTNNCISFFWTNSEGPDQTALKAAVGSGATLFAILVDALLYE